MHCLRHSYVTHLVEYGYPERFVQEQVGHAYASTTAIYASVSNDFKNKTLQAALSRVYAPSGKEEPMMSRRIVMGWNLRQVMATRSIFQTSELVPLLAERGVQLSREHVYRLVTKTPQRLNIDVLAALCDILDCEPNDLLQPTVQHPRAGQDRHRGTGSGHRRPPSDPGHYPPPGMSRRREPVPCGHCGLLKQCSRIILEQSVCQPCQLRFARDAQTLPRLWGASRCWRSTTPSAGRPAPAAPVNRAVYACDQCGREDSQWGRRCAPCVLTERLTALLSEPGAGIHPRLQPLFDVLICGPRPQTTLYWFDRSTGPATLAAMARGEVEISHAAFEAMPLNQTNTYLRDLLAAVGVLPPFHAELERVTRWLNTLLTALPGDQADILTRFARWHVIRRLRHHEQAGTLTHGAISAARGTIVATTRFMHWQTSRGRPIHATTQDDLDRYSHTHRGRALALAPFLAWAATAGTLTKD